MIRKALLSTWVMLALAFGVAGVARAETFNFSYNANGTSTMGIFNATAQGNGQYLIDSITNGTRNGRMITLLRPGSFGLNDNILQFPNTPYFDVSGFSFTDGQSNYNVFSQRTGYFEGIQNVGPGPATNVTVEQTPAPLPGGGLLSFLALGLAGLTWRRKALVALTCRCTKVVTRRAVRSASRAST